MAKNSNNKLTVFITGATSGIGQALALDLADAGFNLVINGRRNNRLIELKNSITSSYNVCVDTYCFDVANCAMVKQCFEEMSAQKKGIDILINNAGLALDFAPIDEGVIEDWDTMINTNLKGLLYVTKYAIPFLKKSKKPQIINIGSIAGKETYPNGNVYCAGKHAVDSISKAMRIDLLKYGIKVTQVCPGAVETEFSEVRFKGDKERAKNVYKGFKPLKAEDISYIIRFIISLPPHVNINDLLIMPTAQAGASLFNKKP